ncbi:MAG: shikimate kinase [Chthoniobacteraceae bacterium]
MGSGKSSVGRILALRFGFPFVDTDHLVIQATGMQITEIFKTRGEAWFRDQETLALESLAGKGRHIIATGGGIILRESNAALLKKIGLVVWLRASEETIFKRVSRNQKRPLVQTENPRETIHNLLTQRTPLYTAAAEFIVDTCDRTHEQVADTIILEAERGI